MKFDHCVFTDKGGRSVNEDSVAAVKRGEDMCFILCDGLGGHGMGDLASSLAVEHITEYFQSCGSIEEFASDVLPRAQAAMKQAQKQAAYTRAMRTTAVVLCVSGNKGICLHIGDSRLYRFRDGRVISRTRDHSIPQVLYMSGEIEEAEIRRHPDRNRLLHALGEDSDELRYERTEFDVREGDAFLLCSDGFWEPVTEPEMEALLAQNGKASKWLGDMERLAVKNSAGVKMDN